MDNFRTTLNQWSQSVKTYMRTSRKFESRARDLVEKSSDREAKILIKMWEEWIVVTETKLLGQTNKVDDCLAMREQKLLTRKRKRVSSRPLVTVTNFDPRKFPPQSLSASKRKKSRFVMVRIFRSINFTISEKFVIVTSYPGTLALRKFRKIHSPKISED